MAERVPCKSMKENYVCSRNNRICIVCNNYEAKENIVIPKEEVKQERAAKKEGK